MLFCTADFRYTDKTINYRNSRWFHELFTFTYMLQQEFYNFCFQNNIQKMKIAFYLPNKFCATNCTDIDSGNPGIGGTEYMIIAISYYLTIRENGHEIFLFAQNDNLLPEQCNVKRVLNVRDALFKSKEEKNNVAVKITVSEKTN